MFVVLDSLKLALENTEVMSIYSIFLLMASLNSTVYVVWLHTSFTTVSLRPKKSSEILYI